MDCPRQAGAYNSCTAKRVRFERTGRVAMRPQTAAQIGDLRLMGHDRLRAVRDQLDYILSGRWAPTPDLLEALLGLFWRGAWELVRADELEAEDVA